MGKIGKFFSGMFSEWGSGLSGPASVPFVVLALFTSGTVQKTAYASLAIILGFVSAYRIWLKEHDRAEATEKEIEELRKKFFNERPKLGLNVHSIEGPRAWMEHGAPVTFTIQHLSGRVPTSVRFDPIPSKQGKFLLQFDPLAHVDPPHEKPMSWDVIEVGVPLLSAKDREKTASIKKDMLNLFLKDTPSFSGDLEYTLVVNFTDGEELRTQTFHLNFETNKYRFSENTA